MQKLTRNYLMGVTLRAKKFFSLLLVFTIFILTAQWLIGCGGESKNNPALTSSQGDVKIFDPEKVPFINSRGEHGYFARQELPDFADPQKVASFYGRAKVADLGTFNGTVQQDKAGTYHTFTVPSGSTSLNVKLSWPKPSTTDDIDLHLINPNGKEYAWDKDTTGYSGFDVNPEWFAIPNPAAGQWKAFAYGYAISSGSSSTYSILANAEQPDTTQPPSGGTGGTSTFTGSVKHKDWWSGTISVPSGATQLKVSVSWSGNSDLDLHLYSPSGKGYGYAEDSTGYNGFWKNPEEITLSNPASGTWTVKMYGYTVPTSIGSQSFSGTVTITTGTSGGNDGVAPDQKWSFDSSYSSNLKGLSVNLYEYKQTSSSYLHQFEVIITDPTIYGRIWKGYLMTVTNENIDVGNGSILLRRSILESALHEYNSKDYDPTTVEKATAFLLLGPLSGAGFTGKAAGLILNIAELASNFSSNIGPGVVPSTSLRSWINDPNSYDVTMLATTEMGIIGPDQIVFNANTSPTDSTKGRFFLKLKLEESWGGFSYVGIEFSDWSKPVVQKGNCLSSVLSCYE